MTISKLVCLTDICLTSHNRLRDLNIDTPKLIWDYRLAAAAQAWANHLAAINGFQHDDNRGDNVGENIYGATGPKQSSCAEASLSW